MRAALAWVGGAVFWGLVIVGVVCFYLAARVPFPPEDEWPG